MSGEGQFHGDCVTYTVWYYLQILITRIEKYKQWKQMKGNYANKNLQRKRGTNKHETEKRESTASRCFSLQYCTDGSGKM